MRVTDLLYVLPTSHTVVQTRWDRPCSRVQLKRDGTRWRTRGKVKGKNWRMEWVASTLHTTAEHDVSSITTADAHTSSASSRLNWRPCRFKWTRPLRQKTKYGSARVPSHFKRSLRGRHTINDKPFRLLIARDRRSWMASVYQERHPWSTGLRATRLKQCFSNVLFRSRTPLGFEK
jgi:hypothetical protein